MTNVQDLIFTEFENLKIKFQDLEIKSARDVEKIKHYESELQRLQEIMGDLKRRQFGKKSERWESSEQGLLFNEAEVEASKAAADDDEEWPSSEIKVNGHARKRGHRRALPENLEREIIKVELPAEELFTEENIPLKIIGYEISEKLKYEPAKMSVIEYHRAKYGVESGDYEKTAPPVPSIIPKGIATAELLAAIVVGKYADGLPLYRMEEIFLRHDIDLSRGTMGRWMVQVAKACQPIINVLSDRFMDSFYIACDETSHQVLKEKDRKAETKSWMWVRSTPFGDRKVILFDYDISRSGATAQKFLSGYKGFLQTDGLKSYGLLDNEKDIIRIGCNMHGRRKFESAATVGAKSGISLGEVGVGFYKKIYDFEEEIKSHTPDERFKLREEKIRPVWEEFKSWTDASSKKVPPKSKIGEAFHYFNNEYDLLIGYLKDGRLNPDNGFTERAIRKFAIGRNNWMFSDSEAGAHASAVLYSLVITAKVNQVNPYKALVELFTELPKATTINDYERLTEIILSPK